MTQVNPSGLNVRLFNVKYSPNLGDGLLSECLEQALITCGANASTHSVDLAARTSYTTGGESRSLKLRVLEAIPAMLRPLAVRLPLAIAARKSWAPHYARGLEGADCVVIGGGNLLADLDLNFPTKLSLAIHAAAGRGLPVYIYGCGVSAGWSKRGLALLNAALSTGAVRRVFVRDEMSKSLWDRQFGDAYAPPASVVRDPGLLACNVYAGASAPSGGSGGQAIGVNVISHIALKYHAADAPSHEALEAWYLGLVASLIGNGQQPVLFTNGSPEDRAYLAALRPKLESLSQSDRILFPDAATPAELVELIAALGGLVAFRMHAIIAAYSCGVPFLALSWDPKLDAFVKSVNKPDWLCAVATSSPTQSAAMLAAAMAGGIAPSERLAVVEQAMDGVAKLYEAMVDERAG